MQNTTLVDLIRPTVCTAASKYPQAAPSYLELCYEKFPEDLKAFFYTSAAKRFLMHRSSAGNRFRNDALLWSAENPTLVLERIFPLRFGTSDADTCFEFARSLIDTYHDEIDWNDVYCDSWGGDVWKVANLVPDAHLHRLRVKPSMGTTILELISAEQLGDSKLIRFMSRYVKVVGVECLAAADYSGRRFGDCISSGPHSDVFVDAIGVRRRVT
jgi:hypothetical protein